LPEKKSKVVIYGGNGFVGTHLAQRLSQEDVCVMCLSRTGHKPLHLRNHHWSESIHWCKDDANSPDFTFLSDADVVVISIGAPPTPTFSRKAYEKQFNYNGSTPFFFRNKYFAYSQGKDLAFKAAKQFAALSPQHSAVILQPGAIYGKRYLQNGKVLPLDTFLTPFSKVLPSQFISIDKISSRLVDTIVNEEKYLARLSVIEHCDI